MAIPAFPNNFYVQQGNFQVFLSWDLAAGATSYSVQKSTDGINFITLATPTGNSYLDTTVTIGTQYYYQVASVNVSGISPYTLAQSIIPTPTSEMSLAQLRLLSQQRADRVNSNFVTLPEINGYINQSMFELYDLLITTFEDYFLAPPIQFTSVTQQYIYPLPDGILTFQNPITKANVVAPPFLKLRGVDLGLNSANNAWVTVQKFNFIDRNRYVYPNTASTIYGVFNLQYRVMGNNIEFIPPPSGNQPIQLWYIPRLNQLLKDTDLTTIGYSGWLEYVITDVAIKILQKEESDITVLAVQKANLIKRIEETGQNRDVGQPDTVSDTRQNGMWGSNSDGYGGGGPIGGY